jgi:hypothetical protein
MTSTAVWRVGKTSRDSQKRTMELVREVKKARSDVEEAAKVADITSSRLRRMAGDLIRANVRVLEDAVADDPNADRRV